MAVYAGLPTAGLAKETAERYAAFLEYAAGKGQEVGVSIGQLPPGYLPLPDNLQAYALKVAQAVRAQKGEVPPPPDRVLGPPDNAPGRPIAAPGVPAGGAPPSLAPGGPDSGRAPALAAVRTSTEDSWAALWLLPLLIAIGVVAAVLLPVAALATPGHPARLLASRTVDRVAGWFA
jgi:hypothetical protein